MLNIHKFQSGYELFTTLCIVEDSDLADICEYLTSSRGSCCKSESIVIVISGTGITKLFYYQLLLIIVAIDSFLQDKGSARSESQTKSCEQLISTLEFMNI